MCSLNRLKQTNTILIQLINCHCVFICLLSLCGFSKHACAVKTSLNLRTSSANEYSISEFSEKRSAFLATIMSNSMRLNAIAGNSVTLTCSIDLDDVTFSKSGNYKVIWSRKLINGADYEPLFLDDTRLVYDKRFSANRFLINKETHNQLQWNLVINDLEDVDTRMYICQLNRHPYDIYWLKRFIININVPASFINDNVNKQIEGNSFVKTVDEFDTLRIKCLANGKPKPVVNWSLQYSNGSTIRLNTNSSQISIANIKLSSRMKQVECQISNGYGAGASRIYRIDIRHQPYIKTRTKKYRVPVRVPELKLRCLVSANPSAEIVWMFLPRNQTSSHSTESDSIESVDNNEQGNWLELNTLASYSLRQFTNFEENNENDNENLNSIYTLPLSKYQIFEKQFEGKYIDTILSIKNFNEEDYGSYSCIATNVLGRKSAYFSIKELTNKHLNKKQIIRFLKKNKTQSNLTRFFEDVDEESSDAHEYYIDYSNRAVRISAHEANLVPIIIFIFVINHIVL